MPLYFFDVHDARSTTRDTDGAVCVDAQAVRETANRILADIAADEPPQAETVELLTTVRDEAGCLVYTATLRVTGSWLKIPMVIPSAPSEPEIA